MGAEEWKAAHGSEPADLATLTPMCEAASAFELATSALQQFSGSLESALAMCAVSRPELQAACVAALNLCGESVSASADWPAIRAQAASKLPFLCASAGLMLPKKGVAAEQKLASIKAVLSGASFELESSSSPEDLVALGSTPLLAIGTWLNAGIKGREAYLAHIKAVNEAEKADKPEVPAEPTALAELDDDFVE